ncbi:AMP-activated serine/threonine-protein kinase regulatory subunit [Lithohypha guttulata]|uniref:AMP-activated serine/threonine-protein kinase regulatory subunit n=1 Tax=Lithohypha guttulata TaxID=1690604 RepID=UPI002DE0821F|nr:AMP-activated serine/threonine-protein kinase regulatory subunit [Lithohypha guttulata]KAK5103414.1 AMP-activated serine/threonine-protein kinase regulatory subunit [Lithohypha guttulata]
MSTEKKSSGVDAGARDNTPPINSTQPSHHEHLAQRESTAEPSYVRPSDLLRPRQSVKHDRPIDKDERSGLKAIRDFLRHRNCYEVLPLSFRLIELDVGLTVKESLSILVQCGIVSAPLWDSQTSTYAGLLTVNDYLNVIRYYNLHTDQLKNVDNLLLSDLKEVEHVLQVKSPETISTSPEAILYDALRKQLISRARRIPLVSYDSESARTMVVSVITQYRILKFIAMNVDETDKLHVLLNVFEAVDVIELLKGGDYSNLNWSVGKALAQRPKSHPGVYTCSLQDGLDTIFETIKKSRVHRLTVVDEHSVLVGCISLSDILQFLLVDGPED